MSKTVSLRQRLKPELVIERLLPVYGPVEWRPRMAPLDELIFTVLTQHTSDLNAGRAFKAMQARFPTWQDVVSAQPPELAEAINSGGLANQKSVRVQQILREVLRREGSFSLDALKDMPLDEAREWLKSLPGVGPKTAAVVLAFSFGMPAMPVDTHIHRVARRLGLITEKTTADQAHGLLENKVRPYDRFRFHVLLITHGRRTCKARRPLCGQCSLSDVCPSKPGMQRKMPV
jgi:endonuclease-3